LVPIAVHVHIKVGVVVEVVRPFIEPFERPVLFILKKNYFIFEYLKLSGHSENHSKGQLC
jgi:hypothetical protein